MVLSLLFSVAIASYSEQNEIDESDLETDASEQSEIVSDLEPAESVIAGKGAGAAAAGKAAKMAAGAAGFKAGAKAGAAGKAAAFGKKAGAAGAAAAAAGGKKAAAAKVSITLNQSIINEHFLIRNILTIS